VADENTYGFLQKPGIINIQLRKLLIFLTLPVTFAKNTEKKGVFKLLLAVNHNRDSSPAKIN